MNPEDLAFALFGQAMPLLDAGVRVQVVDDLYEGEYGLALQGLLGAIGPHPAGVDPHLLASCQASLDRSPVTAR